MRISYVVLGALLFFCGCASKEQTNLLDSLQANALSYEAMGQTEQVTISEHGKVIGFLSATYLHKKSLIIKHKPEEFIIGIYTQNESEEWGIKLNNVDPLSITKLQSDDERLSSLPMHNEWSEYYIVTFAYDKSKQLTLQYADPILGTHDLKYSKVANYIHTKEAF